MRQIMSCACVMHIHGLGTKSMSRSPICFNELGSWGERLNFSFEFQTEKVKGALLCQREREREGGEQRGERRCVDSSQNLLPGYSHKNIPFFLCGSQFCIVNIRVHMDL